MQQVFEIGDKVEITPVKASASASQTDKYVSQVLDYDDIRTVKIAAPFQDGHLVPLRVDEDIKLCLFTRTGLYTCRARIKKRSSEKRLPMLEVLLVSQPEKYQRRNYYRLECSFEMQYRRMSAEERKLRSRLNEGGLISEQERKECEKQLSELPVNWQTATITDLSGGGLRFHLNEKLDGGEPVEVAVPLAFKGGDYPLQAFCHVVECFGEQASYKIARCEFDAVTKQERETIIKYVFEEQRRRMSGGER